MLNSKAECVWGLLRHPQFSQKNKKGKKVRVSNLRPREDLQRRHEIEEQLVIEAIKQLGGIMRLPVMKFRRHLAEPMRETQIKKTLQRLQDRGQIELLGERHDCRGHTYKLVTA